MVEELGRVLKKGAKRPGRMIHQTDPVSGRADFLKTNGAERRKATETMEYSALIEIAIEDGTIVNSASASVSVTVRNVKRWGAVVTKDLAQPGGLARKFLDSRDSGRVLLIKGVNLQGATIEMAEIFETYRKCDGRDYRYFFVEGVFADRLIVRQITAGEVPKGTPDNAKRDTDPSAALLKIIDELRGQVAQLEAQIEAQEKQRAAAKNVANRIKRTLSKGVTLEDVKVEIDQLNKSLQRLKTAGAEQAEADESEIDAVAPVTTQTV